MNYKVAILGCARDCGNTLPLSLQHAHDIGRQFIDYRICIMENDSIDNTGDILRYAAKDSHVEVITEKYLKLRYPYRTWRIAYCRNRLLKKLVSSGFKPDFVIVMDMDNIGNSKRGAIMVKNCIYKKDLWDAIFPRISYDTFAFRYPGHTYNSFEIIKNVRDSPERTKYMEDLGAPSGDDSMFDENGLMAIFSSFNGLAIYKYELYIRGTYCGRNRFFSILENSPHKNQEECEHVNFHRSLGPCRLMMSKDFLYP